MSEPQLQSSGVSTLDHLRRRERKWIIKIIAMFVFGIPLSFLGAALVGSLFWFAYIQWGHWVSWIWFFLLFAAVLTPLLFRLEIKTEGDYLGRAAQEFKGDVPAASAALIVSFSDVGMIAAALANPRAALSGFVEIFLFGPRLVVGAARQMRLRRLSEDVNGTRVAQVLETLNEAPAHVRPESLLAEGEDQQQLSRVLAYLLFFQWIGVAHDGTKVWILTESRRVLGGEQ